MSPNQFAIFRIRPHANLCNKCASQKDTHQVSRPPAWRAQPGLKGVKCGDGQRRIAWSKSTCCVRTPQDRAKPGHSFCTSSGFGEGLKVGASGFQALFHFSKKPNGSLGAENRGVGAGTEAFQVLGVARTGKQG